MAFIAPMKVYFGKRFAALKCGFVTLLFFMQYDLNVFTESLDTLFTFILNRNSYELEYALK